jgi:large subunit ribosomal protein L7/L12
VTMFSRTSILLARCAIRGSNHRRSLPVVSSTVQQRQFHYSARTQNIENKNAKAAQPTEEEQNETDETVPVWQNPQHHDNNQEKKIFKEEFKTDEEMPVQPLPPLSAEDNKVAAPPHIEALAHEIVNLSLLEVKELTDKIADHFGFDDAVMAASYGGGAVAAAGPADAALEAPAEKTLFDVKLSGFDAKAKIKVIKEVRAIAGLGLKEAKELVESAPKVVSKDLSQEKADELKAQLEAVGATVEIV